MEKYNILSEVANKLKALDNTVKLKILALLVEEGAKSITDISKDLNINFSTAHKYLEQLEKAKLVTSKQVADNRLKRLFYVKDFGIDLSPAGIANLLAGTKKKEKRSFKVINEQGEVVNFNEKIFAQKYLKRGLPRGLITYALSSILEQAYDGITLIELREIFQKALEKRAENISDVLDQLEDSHKHKRTFAQLLQLICPEALEQHAKGDIFIRNLREPKLFNFAHDLRGIAIHGINGKRPKTLKDLFQQSLTLIKALSKYLFYSQGFASFNYFVAPLAKNLNDRELEKTLIQFFDKINEFGNVFYVNLDIGTPRFANKESPSMKGSDVYSDYNETASRIYKKVVNILKSKDYVNIKPIFKIWTKNFDTKLVSGFKEIYIANMLPEWQTVNATYIGTHRFDWSWKKNREAKVGTLQAITINLPRLALKSKSEKEFFIKLNSLIDNSLEYTTNMIELIFGEFLKKYKTTFPSAFRGRWDYAHANDSAYHIALTGLNEAIKILTNKDIAQNSNLAKKIVEFCNKIIKSKIKIPTRIELKEARNKSITNRFYKLDLKENKLKVPNYSVGVSSKDITASAKLHKLFCGGHCIEIKKSQIKDFIKSEGGLALIKE